MSSWVLKSVPPHDWYLCLDVESYFDHEHVPEKMLDTGFIRPLQVNGKDIILTIIFNGDVEKPEFHIQTPEELSSAEIQTANAMLAKILGTGLDLRPLYDMAANDAVLGDKLADLYGLKRMTRANLFEDILYRIVQMQMNHKPTAKKMMYQIRERYGSHIMQGGQSLAAWPTPLQLMKADPANIRKLGPTLRKGEYIIGLANDIVAGNVDMDYLAECEPQEFYERITAIRGIGPSAGQDLMMMRGRPDAVFPSEKKGGEEQGLRRWIIRSYGENPNKISEKKFLELIKNWKGYEGAALEFLYVDYILEEKERRAKRD